MSAAVIAPKSRVVLAYSLHDEAGNLVDSSDGEDGEPILYVHGYGMLADGLEAGLAGLAVGDEKQIVVRPEEGFGSRDEDLVIELDRAALPDPEGVVAGDELIAESDDGEELHVVVMEVHEETVVVDANHPLAGKTLRYDVKVLEVVEATDEEIAAIKAALDEGCTCGADHDHGHEHGHEHGHGDDHGHRH